jgi:hypothetical protein
MKNKIFNYKYLAAHKASSYPVVYTGISRLISGRDCYTTPNSDIVIDGFPRCANTYATYAFDVAQTKKVNIAHHIHKQSQFLVARKYNIPGILLIRKPLNCISSLLIRQPKYDPEVLFKGYYFLYNSLKDAGNFVVGDFENVLNNYGSVIRKVNEKFNRNFDEYVKNDENEAKVKEIIHTQDELIGAKDYKQRVAYPTKEREQSANKIKEFLQEPKFYDLHQKCNEIYNYLIELK